MITPEEIRKKAERVYREFLASYLRNEEFFPKHIRFGKLKPSELLANFKTVDQTIKALRESSKEREGRGYIILYEEVKNRSVGRQKLPSKILFETEEDYLYCIKKHEEFDRFKADVALILQSIPRLAPWINENPLRVIENAGYWEDLLKVCLYFIETPRPNLHIRELPIAVHTKFIEENRGILRQLFDFLIPEHVNFEESEFEKRYSLKFNEPLIRIKLLDKYNTPQKLDRGI